MISSRFLKISRLGVFIRSCGSLFQLFMHLAGKADNEWMIMKGCAQWNPVYDRKDPQTIEDQIVGCVWQEELEARQNNKGRNQAVQLLFQILMRKKDGCQQLVTALRDDFIKQPELADLLDPHSVSCSGKGEKKAFPRPESDSSCDSEINKEQARKPCDGTTPVKDLVSTVNSVFALLDVDGINDWKVLTGKLGYTMAEFQRFKSTCRNKGTSPAEAVIWDWCQREDPNLDMLMKVLFEMERKDMLNELEKITNYKCPDIAVSLTESSLQGEQRVCDQNQPVQTLIKHVESGNETDKVNYQSQVRTDRLSNSLRTVNAILGQDNLVEITGTLDVAASDKTVTKQNTEILPETGHTKLENKRYSGMPNSGHLLSLSSFEADYSDGVVDENVDTVSSEEFYDSGDEMLQSDDSVQRLKFRYAESEDGQLKMTAFGNAIADETSVERTDIVPVVRQENVENCPAQTEPSMSPAAFVNLKQQRRITPKMVCQRITHINYEQAFASTGSQSDYVKLHTEEAPNLDSEATITTVRDLPETSVTTVRDLPGTSVTTVRDSPETSVTTVRDLPETSVTTVPVVTEASGKSLMVGAFTKEDQTSSLAMNSNATIVEEVRPEHVNSTAENDSFTDLNEKFLTLSLNSISFCSGHARRDNCQENLEVVETNHGSSHGHNIKNGVIRRTWSPLSTWIEDKVPYILPQASEVHLNKCVNANLNNKTEHLKCLDRADSSRECTDDSNTTDSVTEEIVSHPISHNQKTVLHSNNSGLAAAQVDNKSSTFLEQLANNQESSNGQLVIGHKDNHSINGHASFLTEVNEACESAEHSSSRLSRRIGIRVAAGVMRTMALFNKYI